jgi:hypothetical protein
MFMTSLLRFKHQSLPKDANFMKKILSVWLLSALFVLLAAPAVEAKRSASDQTLYERARKECNNTRK